MLNTVTYLSLLLRSRLRTERGATATEYGLLVALIAFVIVVGVTAFGTELNTFFTDLQAEVASWSP